MDPQSPVALKAFTWYTEVLSSFDLGFTVHLSVTWWDNHVKSTGVSSGIDVFPDIECLKWKIISCIVLSSKKAGQLKSCHQSKVSNSDQN